MLKPIETTYKGYRFRSRLEARWAVFFDGIGARWTYEEQGYELGGLWYLPDFWFEDWQFWVEVKPWRNNELDEDTAKKAIALTRKSGLRMYVVVGTPWPTEYWVQYFYTHPDDEQGVFRSYKSDGFFDGPMVGQYVVPMRDKTNEYRARRMTKRLEGAYLAARGARFEHGEHGGLSQSDATTEHQADLGGRCTYCDQTIAAWEAVLVRKNGGAPGCCRLCLKMLNEPKPRISQCARCHAERSREEMAMAETMRRPSLCLDCIWKAERGENDAIPVGE